MNADKTRINADKMGIISAWMARERFSPLLTAVQPTIDKDIGVGYSYMLASLDRW